MKNFIIIIFLFGFNFAQVINPCEDERFLEISEKYVDQMTEEEFQYFTQKEKECLEYKNGTSSQSYFQKQKNNEKSLTSDKVINLWPAIFLIAIIFLR